MRLTTITINGFKSFAKKTVIDVHKDITGIVGPNGSGKSNIAESVRFVLGEQSMKSMRGGGGTDLIFKGSGSLTALGRASVSLTLSNKGNDFAASTSDRIAPFLAYEEIVLAREISADGGSVYTINGAKVRLKDVEELLALAGIGNNKHTILNQGEADKVLLTSPKERKALIEDALGLKVFQLRIDESEKKLEKTRVHLHEIKALEREMKPHLEYLKRQKEKIRKFEEEKERFTLYAKEFLPREYGRMLLLRIALKETGSSEALALLLSTLEKDIAVLEKKGRDTFDGSHFDTEAEKLTHSIDEKSIVLHDLDISIALIQNELRGIRELLHKKETTSVRNYTHSEVLAFTDTISSHVDTIEKSLDHDDISSGKKEVASTKQTISSFVQDDSKHNEISESEVQALTLQKKQEEELSRKENERGNISKERDALRRERENVLSHKEKARDEHFTEEKRLYTMRAKSSELRSLISVQKEKEISFHNDEKRFETLEEEVILFVGKEGQEYKYISFDKEVSWNRYENLKLLEKSKLRLEEGGITGAHDIETEYEKVQARATYLAKEIEDIQKSEKELEALILEVKDHMNTRYESGLEKVSLSFSVYFKTVFPGGDAKLVKKVTTKNDDEDDEKIKEEGVDIDISLPSKKVKTISAFSGGEKALTAIALLFALAEVSPPPFIILDETDAPLDEHNAKRYGETLALLAKKSKLLVITHNRETMSHCEMLYGVTLGSDGASKLLSVNLK